jgi:lipopolysaccharide export system protein LptA
MRPRDLLLALSLATALTTPGGAEPARDGSAHRLFDAGAFGSRKEPITVTSDTLEYDYKANVVVYRGTVQAAQGEVTLRSDTLTVTFAKGEADGDGTGEAGSREGAGPQRLQEIVAVGNVRIDNGPRWATGGRAVFDQSRRTLVLTENPMLHDGSNEVVGDRVVVYLDEDRSVVEGGRKRVKAVLYPGQDSRPSGPGGTGPAAGVAER